MNMPENDTNISVSEEREMRIPFILSYLSLVGGLFVAFLSLAAIIILTRCRKLVYQIRFASIHLAAANFGFGINTFIVYIIYVVNGLFCTALLKLFPFFFIIYYLFLTTIGIDRLLSLKFAMRYTFWTNKKNATYLALALYIFGCVTNLPNMSPELMTQCQDHPKEIFTYVGIVSYFPILLSLLFTQILTYGFIGFKAIQMSKVSPVLPGESKEKVKSKVFKNFWHTAIKSFHLCVMSAALLGPWIISRIYEVAMLEADEEKIPLNFLMFIAISMMLMHQIFSPIFILLSYKECRYMVLKVVCYLNKNQRQKLTREYKQHYATFCITNSSHHHSLSY